MSKNKSALAVFKTGKVWIVKGTMKVGRSEENIRLMFNSKKEAMIKARAIISAYVFITRN